MDTFAHQTFDAGIIIVSYFISVIGALTTLELLTQRTHYKGAYNWFLLLAAAFCMGGVGIWSMHFIGNNSLRIRIPGDTNTYQLAYSAGFTFISLVMAIFCTFLAFAFVGITEEARLLRIVPSGVLAGSGIALMHYLGQFAIRFFVPRYKVPYVIGAIIIAITAVTVALYIFFKLREQWANQWYKRLGCAMLMGVAVCGMHYTAMAGTEYLIPTDTDATAPVPSLSIAALIGIISGVVVIGCAILVYIVVFRHRGIRSAPPTIASSIKTEKIRRRLVLDAVVFDNKGKILVRVDGILPMRTVMNDMSTHIAGPFSVSHPLFQRFFEATTQWTRHPNIESYNDPILQQYMDGARELAEELKIESVAELGLLFDSVLHAQTTTPKNKQRNRFFSSTIKRSPSAAIRLLSSRSSQQQVPTRPSTPASQATVAQNSLSVLLEQQQQQSHLQVSQQPDIEAAISPQDEKQMASGDSDDEHIFLVRKIGSDKDLAVKLLSQGFRFADPVFIARIMGAKLNLSAEHMQSYFRDMKSMVDSANYLSIPKTTVSAESLDNNAQSSTPPQSPSSSVSSTRSLSMPFTNTQLRGSVYVGLLALVEEKHHHHQENINSQLEILVDKKRHFSFPIVPLQYDDDRNLLQLGREEKSCVYNLQGQSMLAVSMLDNQLPSETTSMDSTQSSFPMMRHQHNNSSSSNVLSSVTSSLFSPATIMAGIGAPTPAQQTAQIRQFIKALSTACKTLVHNSNYRKLLGTGARLHGEVIEVPPFTLVPGPCDLILFRTLVTIPGTQTAINQTPTEPIKCIPLKLYKSFAYHVTDQAVELYRQTSSIARSTSIPSPRQNSRKKFPQLMEGGPSSIVETFAGRRGNGNRSSPSLTSSNSSARVQATAVELPIMVNLMPTQARFLWLDLMVDETLQAHKSNRRP
ncbi:hypothetical protein BJV82DRAFT_667992 [Fennellomyces sp. T-0311]|nr:hypothetical protein BJV82DRAFT_667992 [Fennellomyces sp. T-0311]